MQRKFTTSHLVALGFALLGFLAAASGEAQTSPLWPHLSLAAGAASLDSDDKIRIDASATIEGTTLDLEADLGLPESETVTAVGLDWQFGERHSLGLRYTALEREGAQSIDRVFRIRDVVFPVSAQMRTRFDTTALDAFYSYWFVRRESFGAAVSLGVSAVEFDAAVEGTARFGPGSVTETRSVAANTDAPVPMIGLALKGSPFRRLVLHAEGRYLPRVTVEDIDGEATTYSIGADFQIAGPLLVGVAYEGTTYEVDIARDDWRGAVDLDSKGFRAGLRLSF
jgi:hypothetical protein